MTLTILRVVLYLFITIIFFSCNNNREHLTSNLKIFKYNESSDIKTLDPLYAKDQAHTWVINQLFNGLVQLDNELKIKPAIAKKWEIRNEGKEYVFTLRNDVTFHDTPLFNHGKGRKVVAQDFVYSFNRILDSDNASPGLWIFNHLDITKADHGFEAVNDSVFKIHLKKVFPPFLGILSMQYCSVVPHEVVEFYKKEFRNHPIGTGPFKFKLWEENEKLILVKNESYFESDKYGNKLPSLDAISISFIPDKHAAFLEFVKGKLHLISGIDAGYKDDIINKSGHLQSKYQDKVQLLKAPYLNTEYLGFLMDTSISQFKNSPLQSKEIRQAINYGFDRNKMMATLRNNIGIPALNGFVPPGMPGFEKENTIGYHYNVNKAKELLAEAGYPNGKGLPEITLHTNNSYLDLCEYIQHELSQIGIHINIEVVPSASLRQYMAKSGVNFFRGSWIADYGDAENHLALFYSKNFCPDGPNYTHFKNSEFDSLYRLSNSEVNDSMRYQYYRKMDQLIMEEAPVVVLYYDIVTLFVQKNVTGVNPNAINLLTLKYADFEQVE